MAQIDLQGPNADHMPLNTTDETPEKGWSPKRIIAAINTMFTEVYAGIAAAALGTDVTAIQAALATSSLIKFVDVTVTSAQLLALNATPQTIVAAPGAGLALLLESIVIVKPAGTAYAGIAGGEDLAVKYTDAAGAVLATIETTGFLDQATAQVRAADAYAAASGVNSSTPSNTPLVLSLLVGEIITGTSDLLCRVYYRVIPTTLP